MDIELARTFLEVVSTGSFIKASERLHVTQTTVTVRIKTLENLLACQLFVRNRSGAKLTQEGEKFVEYASSLVHIWSQAKNEMLLPTGKKHCLKLGAETSLWNPLMLNWVIWIKEHLPDAAVDSEVENASHLISNLERGNLDAVILHRPNYYSGYVVEQLLEEKLIHVCTPDKPEPFYFIHWGEDFNRQYDAALPQPKQSPFSFNLGQHAFNMMLKTGGNGWFRTRVVAPYLQNGILERVTGSPEFTYPVYLSYRKSTSSDLLLKAMKGLKESVLKEQLTIV